MSWTIHAAPSERLAGPCHAVAAHSTSLSAAPSTCPPTSRTRTELAWSLPALVSWHQLVLVAAEPAAGLARSSTLSLGRLPSLAFAADTAVACGDLHARLAGRGARARTHG